MVLPSPVGESVAANLITPLPRCVPHHQEDARGSGRLWLTV